MDSLLRVLVVAEDEFEWLLVARELEKATVGAERFRLEACGALGPTVDRLTRGGVDVILLDLHLPDSHGLETIARVRQLDDRTPIVVYSSIRDEELALKTLYAGAQDYVVKGDVCGAELERVLLLAVEHQRKGPGGSASSTRRAASRSSGRRRRHGSSPAGRPITTRTSLANSPTPLMAAGGCGAPR